MLLDLRVFKLISCQHSEGLLKVWNSDVAVAWVD